VTKVEWVPNPNFEAEFRRDPATRAALVGIAKDIAARTNRVKIRRYGGPETRGYAKGDGAEVARMEPWAAIDEYGGTGLAPSAALRNAIRATPGVKFEEQGR
jgi:hypothetical protein